VTMISVTPVTPFHIAGAGQIPEPTE